MLNAILEAQFALRIAHACQAISLRCSTHQIKALLAYLRALQRWNKTYNLTALRHPEQMLVQHVLDSLTVAPALLARFDASQPYSVCDVGAGGGLPGVVIAIMVSAWQVHCVDAVAKKTAFVRQMVGALELPNLRATHARIETLPDQNADIVISRAFASLHDFATWSGRHVGKAGVLVGMKGKSPDDEIKRLHAATPWRVVRVEALKVPELEAQRCLVWMSRI
jgi:16S rRNA (guanine527-N7)-methyltransferase